MDDGAQTVTGPNGTPSGDPAGPRTGRSAASARLRALGWSISRARLAAGLTLVMFPRSAGRLLVGGRPPTALVRAIGVRELVLGFGTAEALAVRSGPLGMDDPARPWLVYGAVVDAVDAVATLADPAVGRRRWALVPLLAAAAGAVAALALAPAGPDDPGVPATR